jgi:hypothetical protein
VISVEKIGMTMDGNIRDPIKFRSFLGHVFEDTAENYEKS